MGWIPILALAAALVVVCGWVVSLLLDGRKTRRRFDILGQVAAVSDGAVSLTETFDSICTILVPAIADFCMIDVIEGGVPRRVAARVAPGGPAGVERGLRERLPSMPEVMLAGGGEGAMKPRFFERMSERELREISHDEDDLAFLRGMGVRSAITVALKARGQVMGALTLGVAWSGRRYGEDDARFARILAGRVALALDNSGLFADLERAEGARAQIAETLQHGLLPPPLPHIPGWSLAAMYRPAGAENEVGGDFYDAFRISDGWIVVIGDVTGRGAEAASVTALARYTLRTAAVLTNDPLVALATLNRALLGRHEPALCSIAAVSLSEDPAEPVRVAVAGHPPPLLVDGEAVGEAVSADPVLGAFPDVEWEGGEVCVSAGQQLVLVTDGVTDACGSSGRFGEERLRERLAGATSPAQAVQRIEGALHEFTAGALDDDAAVLAIARASEPAGQPLALTGAATATGGIGD
jgi:serine phosphatase RsbU (regulator of sigma subunit)